MNDLRSYRHSFENGSKMPDPMTTPKPCKYFPQGADSYSNDVSVVRPNNRYGIFNGCFADMQVCLPTIIKFVLQNGAIDQLRDCETNTKDPIHRRRFTFGCCGQDWKGGKVDGVNMPSPTYGFGKFEDCVDKEDGEVVKMMLASLVDGMQMAFDEIELKHLHNPLPYNDEQRNARFGAKLNEKLGCYTFRGEDVTIQLKNISQHERTSGHRDDQNCAHKGWTKTFALCFTLKDAVGDIWSVKILCNSRTKAGEFEDRLFKLDEIFTRIHRQMDLVNADFEKLMLLQRSNGGHQYHERVTALHPHRLVLDDSCPWEEVDIGNGVMVKCMKINANIVRDIQLSAPGTIGYEYYQQVQDVRKTIELLLMAGYHPGHYARFYHIGREYMAELTEDGVRPSVAYYKRAVDVFGCAFGDNMPRRMNVCGIKFDEVFFDKDGNLNEPKMDCVVDGILDILHWINEKEGTEEFCHTNIEKKFQDCVESWKEHGHTDLNFKEFRMMIVVQICCLINLVVKSDKDLNNLVYPVSSLGAAKQLKHVEPGDRFYVLNLIMERFLMQHLGTNGCEGSLCETSELRVGNMFDVLYYGQMIFEMASDDGSSRVKHWSAAEFVKAMLLV